MLDTPMTPASSGHADDAGQQSTHADEPDQEVDALEQVVHDAEDELRVQQEQRLLVIGGYIVLPRDDFPYARGDVAHGDAFLRREAQEMDGIAQVVGSAGLVDGDVDRIRRPAIDGDAVTVLPVHTNDGIVTAVDADALSDRVAAFGEEFFIDASADNAHFPFLQVVGVVEPPAVFQFRRLDTVVFGPDAFHDGPGGRVLIPGDGLAP